MSGKTPLIAGLKEGFGTILTRPWVIMRQPSVLAVFGVYLATYTTVSHYCLIVIKEGLSLMFMRIQFFLPFLFI